MDDVQRVFERLVEVLSASDPGRLRAPLEVAEIYQTILPYRKYRSQLAFETNQDYEMALLRLLAGEGGFASVDPAEVQNALGEETKSVNPIFLKPHHGIVMNISSDLLTSVIRASIPPGRSARPARCGRRGARLLPPAAAPGRRSTPSSGRRPAGSAPGPG